MWDLLRLPFSPRVNISETFVFGVNRCTCWEKYYKDYDTRNMYFSRALPARHIHGL